jgi:osmotically-inducible protein OsmY
VLGFGLTGSLCGCPLAIVGGIAAAGGAGYAANQERGVGGTAHDFSIKTNIQTALVKTNPDMAASLNVTVYEGRALLTGIAPNPEIKAQAGDIARGHSGRARRLRRDRGGSRRIGVELDKRRLDHV